MNYKLGTSVPLTFLSILFVLSACSSVQKPKTALIPEPSPIHYELDRVMAFQGLTNSIASQITIISMRSDLTFSIASSDRSKPKWTSEIRSFALSGRVPSELLQEPKWTVYHVTASRLNTKANYTLFVRSSDGKELATREFKALDLNKTKARFAMTSCLFDRYENDQEAMWKNLFDQNPDLILMLGDNVYGDRVRGKKMNPVDGHNLWFRYMETANRLAYYQMKTLKPMVATWDDHDYGADNGDMSNPHKTDSTAIFNAFFAQDESKLFPEYQRGPGVASRLIAFGQSFFLLDDRSFRTKNRAGGDDETHFGIQQERWLTSKLKAEGTKRLNWLMSGDQWFGAYQPFDSYEGSHPKSFQSFFNQLKETGARMVFASGDRHMSEVLRIEKDRLGYETYEMTSSPMHSTLHASNWGSTTPNPRQIAGRDLTFQFMVFDLEPGVSQKKTKVQLKSMTKNSQSVFEFDFEL